MKIKKKYLCLIIILIVIFILIYFFYNITAYTSNAYIRANWVEVSPRINGYVNKINVQNNQFVKKDQILFELDRYPYKMTMDKYNSQLGAALEQKKFLESTIYSLQEQVASQQNEMEVMKKERQRFKTLSTEKAASVQKYQTILILYNDVKKNLENLQGKLTETANLKTRQEKLIQELEAELRFAEYRYKHTLIRAPFNGYLTNMYLTRGQFLQQGQAVFGIAQTQKCWIEANFKECWVGKIKPGQKVWIMSDLYPFRFFKGKILSLTNAVNRTETPAKILPYIKPTIDWVRLQYRFTVIIEIESLPKDMHLRMGADARVLVWL
jgi:multidrug efflux system membrane fusion protein